MSASKSFADGVWATSPDAMIASRSSDEGGHVYVVQFGDGIVKVGHAQNPKARIKSHATEAAHHGQTVTQCWSSSRHGASWFSEDDLIAWCAERGSLARGREYFSGIDFDDLVYFAATLATKERPRDAEADRRSEQFFESAKSLLMGSHPGLKQNQQLRQVMEDFLAASDDEIAAAHHWRAREDWRLRTRSRVQFSKNLKAFAARTLA